MVGPKHRVILRLDDGCIIGHGLLGNGPVKISFSKACELNRGGDKDVARLEQLLATAQTLVPKANGVAAQFTPVGGGPAKRARVDSGHLTDVVVTGDWMAKCKTILDKMGRSLGQSKQVFWNAVNPKVLPDYYTIITHPMFFGQVEEKLAKRKYNSPSEFNADVKLAYANCKMYNPAHDPYRKIGEKVEAEYDQLWVASGLADNETMDARGKRATAGIARPKYEPEKFEPPSNPKSHSQGAKAPKQLAAKGTAKAGSHEVTSGGRGAVRDAPVTDARKHEMGELLLSEAFAPHMEALTNLLPPEMLEGADGEFELDFENLDDVTTRKIDDFLRKLFPTPDEGAQASPGGSPASMQQQDDDDEVSEGDLDDADDSDDD